MPESFQYDVFLSYNKADKPRVRRLAQRLRAVGLRVWFDEWVIEVGDDIYLAVERGLEASRALVLCLSPAALGSDWVTLERSTVLFRDPSNTRRRFIPLLLADCKLPDTLRRYKYVDYRKEKETAFQELLSICRDASSPEPALPIGSIPRKQFGKADFTRLSKKFCSSSIDQDVRRKYLAKGDWRYDQLLLPPMFEHGWVRFAAGFKAGIYGHPRKPWCVKILGMGVGDNPSFFAGRGYYNEHERRMLETFAKHGFTFQPPAKSVDESIAFLVKECGVQPDQARWQCENHNVLITERILGMPFATATGDFLHYQPDIAIFNSGVLRQCELALHELKVQLDEANRLGLLHNDPVPANLIFTLGTCKTLSARLVDFELAQNLNERSPDFVSSSVRELYAEREVPINAQTGKHRKNLDQHLMEQALEALGKIRNSVEEYESGHLGTGLLSASLSLVGGITIDLGDALSFWGEHAGVRGKR